VDLKTKRNKLLFCSTIEKNISTYSDYTVHRMGFEFDHLGEFEFIFKQNLGYESGDQEVLLMRKKPEVKNLMQVYFKDSSSPNR
jgi:hypothetical protein